MIKKVYDEIADKAINSINDNGVIDEVLKENGVNVNEDFDNDIVEMLNFSLIVVSDEDLDKIKRAFPKMIIGIS